MRAERVRAGDHEAAALLALVARYVASGAGPAGPPPVTAPERPPGVCSFCQNDGSRCWVCQPD